MNNKGDRVKVISGQYAGSRGKIDCFWLDMFCPDGKTVEVELDGGRIVAVAPWEIGPDLADEEEKRKTDYDVTQTMLGFGEDD